MFYPRHELAGCPRSGGVSCLLCRSVLKKIVCRNYIQSFHVGFEFVEIAFITRDDKAVMRPSGSRNESVVLLLLSRCDFLDVASGIGTCAPQKISHEF